MVRQAHHDRSEPVEELGKPKPKNPPGPTGPMIDVGYILGILKRLGQSEIRIPFYRQGRRG